MASKSFTNGFRPRRALVAGGAVAVFLMGVLFGGMASLTLWPQQQDPFNLMQAELPDDAADALGAAICHANTSKVAAEEFRIQ